MKESLLGGTCLLVVRARKRRSSVTKPIRIWFQGKVMASNRIVLRSELYKRGNKCQDSRSTCQNVRLVLDWDRSGNRNTSAGNRNGCSGCNSGLREKAYAVDGKAAIIARDVGVKIGTSAGVTNLRLVVLRSCHCEMLRGIVQWKLMQRIDWHAKNGMNWRTSSRRWEIDFRLSFEVEGLFMFRSWKKSRNWEMWLFQTVWSEFASARNKRTDEAELLHLQLDREFRYQSTKRMNSQEQNQ